MKLRGVGLLASVFAELRDAVPEGSITTEELLAAAQSLIELSKNDYISKPDREPSRSSDYFSHELTLAFERYQARILKTECSIQYEHELSLEGRCRLKRILKGEKHHMYLELFDG